MKAFGMEIPLSEVARITRLSRSGVRWRLHHWPAEEVIKRPRRDKKPLCKNGHELDGSAVQRGRSRRYCKTCQKLYQRERRMKMKLEVADE